MSRYIDADEIETILDGAIQGEEVTGNAPMINAHELMCMLHDIPSADVTEVVRCKDCMMYKRDKELAEANYCDPNFYCGLLRTEMDEDGFCSYGRRKDE